MVAACSSPAVTAVDPPAPASSSGGAPATMKAVNRENARASTLAREVGYIQKPHGERLRVALAFPNTYFVGMSNLGFQTMYRLFNERDDVVCERVFLPPKQQLQDMLARGTRLVTLESQTPLADFDVLAFSVSFEWDYTNVVSMLRLAGLPLVCRRSARHAIRWSSSAAPSPSSIPNRWRCSPMSSPPVKANRSSPIWSPHSLGRAPPRRADSAPHGRGFYVPSVYDVRYGEDGRLASMEPQRRAPVRRQSSERPRSRAPIASIRRTRASSRPTPSSDRAS